jgi:hypothetical protein
MVGDRPGKLSAGSVGAAHRLRCVSLGEHQADRTPGGGPPQRETSRSRSHLQDFGLTQAPSMASIRPRRRPQCGPIKPDMASRSRACSIMHSACN